MACLVGAWMGCSSSSPGGGTGAQSCQGNPGDEYCSCNAGSCNSGYTCALDLQVCVHIAGTPQSSTGGTSGTGNTPATGSGTGGVTNTGGSAGARLTGTGGVTNSGGSAGTHVTGTGGMNNGGSAGRSTGSGGMTNGGGAGTSTGTGGMTVTATACTGLMPSANGNGEFTHYYFGQGTGKDSQGRSPFPGSRRRSGTGQIGRAHV